MSATDDHLAPLSSLARILERLARGRDADAWAALLRVAGVDMQRLARRIVGEATLADDVLQEALLRIRDHAGRFRPREAADEDAEARRWVMRVTTNAGLDLLRSRQRAARRERRAHQPSPLPSPHEAIERDEQADLLRRELAALPARSGTAIVLHHIAGLSFEEVALELGLPVGTAKTNVRRGLITLRDRLQRAGFALSVTAIAAGLSELRAAETGAALTAFTPLLHSPHAAAAAGGAGVAVAKAVALVAMIATGIAVPIVAVRAHHRSPTRLAFDFEDGRRPAELVEGEVVAGPAHGGSRCCAAGADALAHGQHQRRVRLSRPDGELIAYRPGLRVAFDCWTTGWTQVYVGDTDQRLTFTASPPDVPTRAWTRVTVDLASCEIGATHARAHPAAGDRLGDVELVAWSDGPGELYIDNVVIEAPPP